jgi:hypothetical protein
MIIQWLRNLFTDSNENYIKYQRSEWNDNLKNIIIESEQKYAELGLELQEDYQDKFLEKGITDLNINISRTFDGEESAYITEQNCFEETYTSRLVINYKADEKFLINRGYDEQGVIITIWESGKDGYLTNQKIEKIREIAIDRLEDILFFVDRKR